MERRTAATKQPKPVVVPGIVDTIAGAMSLVLEHPLLFTIPVLFDLYVWLGVRLSPAAFTDAFGRLLLRANSADATNVADNLRRFGERSDMTELLGVLLPSLLVGIGNQDLPTLWRGASYDPGSWWIVAGLSVVFLVLGAGLSMLYRVPLAVLIHGEPLTIARVGRATLWAWIRSIGLFFIVIGLGLLIGGPLLVGAAVLQVLGVDAVPLLTLALILPAIWAAIYLYFTLDAIVVSEVGPLRAIYLSFNVVRRNFWPTVGFALAVLLISTGLPRVWERLIGNPPGLVLAIIANAFIGTGLAVASMMFYDNRLRRWRPDAARSQPERGASVPSVVKP